MANPQQPPAWLAALPALFGIGARIGGSPAVATGALKGAEHANLLAEDQRQRSVQEGQRQQQLDMQTQQIQAQQVAHQEAIEMRRQQAIKSSVDDLRAQKFPTRDDYEKSVGAHEQLLGQFFQVRPNTLRTMVPYNGPTIKTRAYEAMEKITKQPNWADIVANNGVIQFDRDGDDIPESVPVGELMHLAEFPIARDPQTGKPMLPPKEVKAENIQEFDIAYKGVLGEWQAEGKDVTSEAVKGKAAIEARTRIAKASKEGLVAGTPPSQGDNGLKAYQQFTATEKLSKDWATATAPGREMRRQFNLMQTGLQRFKQGDKNGGSQAVLVTFQKILDPTSVVRESEYARSGAGLAIVSRLEGYMDRLRAGGAGVPLPELAAMVETARQFLQGVDAYASGTRKRLGGMAAKYGIDPALVFDDAEPAADTGGASGFTVKAPNGKTYTFATQEQLDKFKASAGIK